MTEVVLNYYYFSSDTKNNIHGEKETVHPANVPNLNLEDMLPVLTEVCLKDGAELQFMLSLMDKGK